MCCRLAGHVACRSTRPARAQVLFIAAGMCLGAATPLLNQSQQAPVYKGGVDLVMVLSWAAADGASRFLALDALPATATSLRAAIEIYPDRASGEAGALTVRFVLRRSEDAAPVATRDVVPGAAAGVLVSSATLSTAALTPGTYVIDVQFIRAGVVLGTATSVFRKGA